MRCHVFWNALLCDMLSLPAWWMVSFTFISRGTVRALRIDYCELFLKTQCDYCLPFLVCHRMKWSNICDTKINQMCATMCHRPIEKYFTQALCDKSLFHVFTDVWFYWHYESNIKLRKIVILSLKLPVAFLCVGEAGLTLALLGLWRKFSLHSDNRSNSTRHSKLLRRVWRLKDFYHLSFSQFYVLKKNHYQFLSSGRVYLIRSEVYLCNTNTVEISSPVWILNPPSSSDFSSFESTASVDIGQESMDVGPPQTGRYFTSTTVFKSNVFFYHLSKSEQNSRIRAWTDR